MILLDTNVFLELLLKQSGAADCRKVLDRVSRGELEATVTHFSIHAVEAALGRGEALVEFLRNVEYSQGLYLHDTGIQEESSAAMMAKLVGLDFDDALQYYVAKRLGAEAIVSYDKHFDGLDIPRVEPDHVPK